MPQEELLRFVRRGDEIVPDPDGRAEGRGAYLCRNPACADQALQRNVFHRALRAAVSIPEPTIDFIHEWQKSESTR